MPTIRPDIFTTPDCPTVKFREAPELIDLDIEIPKVLSTQGWGLGTIFSIQFINHERTKMIKTARFMVITENTSLHTFNPDSQQPMTKQIETREAKQIEDWFYPYGIPESLLEKTVKWNFGAKRFDVMQGKTVLFSGTKEEAEQFMAAA